MRKSFIAGVYAIAVLLAIVSCRGAEQPKDRAAAVAGTFYPADPTQLAAFVDGELAKAGVLQVGGTLIGLVVPHAGYPYSGPVAAYSYAQLKGKKFKRVVLIGPSHFEEIGFSSVYNGDAYTTPLGKVLVDREFAKKLASQGRSIRLSGAGHAVGQQSEHSLEVQLPFLQRTLGDFKIVPIVMGDQSYGAMRELGMGLAKLLKDDPDTLMVASSDLSHYHPYEDAARRDHNFLDAVTHNDFLSMSHNLESGIWEACGGGPIVTVMIAAQHLGASSPRVLKYANSGDVTGDKGRVVGYSAMALVKGADEAVETKAAIADEGRAELLKIARLSVETAVREHKMYEPPPPKLTELQLERGAFVTLTRKGELRGCVGYPSAVMPLYMVVRDVAALAAVRDTRFSPVKPEELKDLEYEISVLSPFVHVLDVKNIQVGRDGLIARKGSLEGYLLPQVPVEEHWNRDTFLEEIGIKAGLEKDAWRDADTDLFTFSAVVFSDHEKLKN
ncbi:MAG TPA: AmmeMemoRadiSam system protein B [Terriglobales bacterium]|nr:AmmeMemoRadiSam system protein B [Terriglobales bacterium]